jgi:hypothetical protein
MAQADFNVANQSGAGFRSDLNNQLLALGTLSSGGSAPSTTYAYQFWADTTAGILKQRNGANSAWISKGTLDGYALYGQELRPTVDNGNLVLSGGGTGGANIELYGPTSAFVNQAYYDAVSHEFRSVDGATSYGKFTSGGTFYVASASLGVGTSTPRGNFSVGTSSTGASTLSIHLGYSASDYYGFRFANTNTPTISAAGTLAIQRGTVAAWTDVITIDNFGLVTALSGLSGAVTRSTAVSTTSGTSVSFTSLPSWVKRISIHLSGVSLSGTDDLLVRLSTGGTFAATGYSSGANYTDGVAATVGIGTRSTVGYAISVGVSTNIQTGTYTFTNITGNIWVGTYVGVYDNDTRYCAYGAGKVTLSGTLDGIRLLPTGSNTFDAGTVNITYEG